MSYGSTRGLTDVRLVEIRVLSSRVRVPEHTITNNTVACNINSLQLWVLVNGGERVEGLPLGYPLSLKFWSWTLGVLTDVQDVTQCERQNPVEENKFQKSYETDIAVWLMCLERLSVT